MKSLAQVLFAACLTVTCTTAAADSQDQFMAMLRTMCGHRFEGGLTYAIDPKNDFAGKKMSTEIICTNADVRMPVLVGEDRSRTWIFTRIPAGLDLRHDHRHPDGTPDAVTMYGGMSNDAGSALSQSFFADAHTFKVFPGSETNVWTISLSADGSVLTYHLDRHAKPRIEFILKQVLAKTIM
ncbi:hypothetical protein [Duganella aceris]|uniref:Secreted protein n=1 Tax=Duganella aceris TaxID=2703883 RepID=A0ABX0FUI1_9BURK|nr:hypothetical protein [Duganella aceris]NGZ88345.1 hypothetical protein [Duganella aceris]